MKKKFNFEISIVLPCFNEKEGITKFTDKLSRRLENKISKNYEIIIVDDGSEESTKKILKKLCKENKKIKSLMYSFLSRHL